MNNQQPTFFTNGERYSLASMLEANADSEEVTEWLTVARNGEVRMFGGGAQAVILVSRVS